MYVQSMLWNTKYEPYMYIGEPRSMHPSKNTCSEIKSGAFWGT